MGKREIIRELATLARNPKISFEKGLIKTLNNDKLGFVSDMNNMEINDNDVLMRRRGTRLMSNPGEPHKFHFIESAFINGVEFMFGLDYKRSLYCWLEFWPELTMEVYDNSFLKKHTQNTPLGAIKTSHLSFQRGSNFWFNDFEDHIDIINNYGDAYRIMKGGFVRIAKRVFEPYNRNIDMDMLNARNGSTTDIACYMDIKDVSNKDFPKNDVNFIDTTRTDFEPVKGQLQFARVNEAGILSTLSDRYILSEYRQGYISMVDGISVSKDNEIEVDFVEVLAGDSAPAEDGVVYVTGASPGVEVETELEEIEQSYSRKAAKLIIPNIHMREERSCFMYIETDSGSITPYDYWGGLPKDKVFLFFPYEGASPKAHLTTSDVGKIIKIENIHFQTNKVNTIGDMFCRIVAEHTGQFVPDWEAPDPAEVTNNIVSLEYTGDIVPDGIGTLYELDIEPEELLSDYVYRLKWTDAYFDDNIFAWTADQPGFFSGLFECELVINPDYSSADEDEYECAEYRYKYKSRFLEEDTILVGLRDKGFDCWEVVANDVFLRYLCKDVNSSNKKIEIDTIGFDTVDVFLNQEDFYNFMDNGFRFAVIKDDNIISKSQRCIADKDTYNPMYSWIDDRVVGEKNYGSKPPEGLNAKLMYLPITSIRNLFSRSEAFKKKEIAEIVRDPKDIVTNNSAVFVLQGGQLWKGQPNWILDQVREINTGVLAIEAFYSGVLLATNSGLFYFNKDMRSVVNGANIKASVAKEVKSGVVVIDRSGDIYLVRMQYTANGAEYPIADKISNVISEEIFSPTSKVASVDDTIYIATDKTVWGFSLGERPRWDKKYEFDKNIDMISEFDNRLLIVFSQNTDKLDVFTLPETAGGAT